MNHTTAWRLVHYPGSGNFLCSRGHYDVPVFRFDDANVYFWDKSMKREVSLRRDSLLSLLGFPVEQTANPYTRAGAGQVVSRGKR